jgi:SAM-dependent methyltransferase
MTRPEPGHGSAHRELILDQFTRQAVPFSTSPGIRDEEALRLVVEFSGVGAADTVLDVACGPGLLTCAFARVARHATGIDLTPAMLDRARLVQRERGLTNVTWTLGDVLALPWPDRTFSVVATRFSFHHLLDPRAALAEMKRVCAPGGHVVVVDSAPAPNKADAFNRVEVLRDPSHVRAMPLGELQGLFAEVGLGQPRATSYRLEGELEALIGRSFPKPGDDDKIRAIFAASIDGDDLGVGARRHDGRIYFGYPVAVLAADGIHR